MITKFTKSEITPFKSIMLNDAKPIKDLTSYESYLMFQNYYFRSRDNELMLRKHENTKELVLARVLIKHRCHGNASQIINELIKLGNQLKYQRIIIESILSPEMDDLAMKHGFIKHGYDAYYELNGKNNE